MPGDYRVRRLGCGPNAVPLPSHRDFQRVDRVQRPGRDVVCRVAGAWLPPISEADRSAL